jgi:hypothetical protein
VETTSVVVGGGGPHHDQELVVRTRNSTCDFPEVYNKLLSNIHFQKKRQEMCVSCFWYFQTSREN